MFPQLDLFSHSSLLSDRDHLRPHPLPRSHRPTSSRSPRSPLLPHPSHTSSFRAPPPPPPLAQHTPPSLTTSPASSYDLLPDFLTQAQAQALFDPLASSENLHRRFPRDTRLSSAPDLAHPLPPLPPPSPSTSSVSRRSHRHSPARHPLHSPHPPPTMARPSTAQRPSYIALPSPTPSRNANGTTTNPNSPLPTPPIGRGEPLASPTSPRASFLGSFMRTRSRAATVTNAVADSLRGRVGASSPTVERPNPLGTTQTRTDRAAESPARDGGGVTRSISTPLSGGLSSAVPAAAINAESGKRTHRIRLVPHLETTRSLHFDPVIREMAELLVPAGILPTNAAGAVTNPGPHVNGRLPALLLKIGRFTDRAPSGSNSAAVGAGDAPNGAAGGGAAGAAGGGSGAAAAPVTAGGGGGDVCSNRVAFKSKVVSRAHAEIWCAPGGKFFIRDTASSSGTFLNHIRLSSPNVASQPMELKDGDVLQLGIDYQNRQEDLFRCVKMRVEVGRDWQRGANEFNTNAFKQLKALGAVPEPESKSAAPGSSKKDKAKASVTDCCICLFSVTVCQSLFIAPCSHVFHYKCIRPLLLQHHPGFSCPLCRTFANLEEDVETEDAWEIASRRASVISRRASNHSIRLPVPNDLPAMHPPEPEGERGTGIGFGGSTRSIDELLAESGTGSGSGRTSEDGARTAEGGVPPPMQGSSALARQATAVPDGQVDEVGTPMPHVPMEVEENGLSGEDGDISGSLAVVADPSRLDDPAVDGNQALSVVTSGTTPSRSVPIGSAASAEDPSSTLLDIQTPMNDLFLSTLAPSQYLASQSQNQGQGYFDTAAAAKRRPLVNVLDEVPELGNVESGDEPLIGGSGTSLSSVAEPVSESSREELGAIPPGTIQHADTMYT